jgi:hypothetical protein
MRHLALVVVLAVVIAPARTGADAQIAEWIGDYAMVHDGHQGTLRIADTKADCAGTPWCHLAIAYTGVDGVRHPARILRIDQANQHMILEIAFPGNRQRFDAYLFSWDKTRMAGTTVWGGRTFGFYAIKRARVADVRPLPRRPGGPVDTRPGNADQPPAAGGSGLVITAAGEIETTMPDGSKRLTRPGVCGWVTVFPDGRRSTASCSQVQPATPPLPDGASATWLEAHSASLLDIARGLLGDNAASIDNYLNTAESGQPGIYDRIRLRTDLITKLTAAM